MGSELQHARRTDDHSPQPQAIVQAKLDVGPSDDRFEREADSMAARVVARLAADSGAPSEPDPDASRVQRAAGDHDGIHRCTDACKHGAPDWRIQRATGGVGLDGGTLDAATEGEIRRTSGGTPLPDETRGRMEQAFGADFSSVRVHTGAQATDLNQRIQAKAFTHGNDIFFRDGMPDAGSRAGQSLLAHELTHTIQQSSGVGRTVQRKKTVFTPPTGKHPITDWVEYSGGTSKPNRSKKLKAVDEAIAAWVGGTRPLGGVIQGNIDKIDEISALLVVWRNSKNDKVSYRDTAVAGLTEALRSERDALATKLAAKQANEAGSDEKLAEFKKMDDASGQFARRGGAQRDDFFKDKDGKMPMKAALAQKNDDGTLTSAALDELDRLNREAREAYISEAAEKTMDIAPEAAGQVDQIMDDSKNPLSERTLYPELANAGGSESSPAEETVAIAGSTFKVTYDSSDLHAPERIEALRTAVTLINGKTEGKVPDLDVFFPKLGRDLTVDSECNVTVGSKIADAIYIAPNFFAVSSQNVGNPKVDMSGGEHKFLSTKLGPKNSMVHSIVHELGHAMHYHNNRASFYGLGFALFKGKAEDGTTGRQQLVSQDVSAYAANNPREMVAEVFLASIVGNKKFSDEIWEMYDAFGGAKINGR